MKSNHRMVVIRTETSRRLLIVAGLLLAATFVLVPAPLALRLGNAFTVEPPFGACPEHSEGVAHPRLKPGAAIDRRVSNILAYIPGAAPLGQLLGSGQSSPARSPNSTAGTTGHFVQWTAGDSGAATSETIGTNSATRAGNLLLVFSHWDNQAIAISSVADNARNRYFPIGGPVNAGPTARFQAWYAKNIKGAGPNLWVTLTYSGRTASFSVVDVVEYSGLDRSAPLDVFASASGSGTSQDSGPSPMTTACSETIIGLFGYSSFALPYTAGAGFTFRGYDASSMLEDRPVTAIGSYNATATSNNSTTWAAFVIGFKNAMQPPGH